MANLRHYSVWIALRQDYQAPDGVVIPAGERYTMMTGIDSDGPDSFVEEVVKSYKENPHVQDAGIEWGECADLMDLRS